MLPPLVVARVAPTFPDTDIDADLYDRDVVAWTEQQAARLRDAAGTRPNPPVDWVCVAEEIDSLGKSDRRELRSHLTVIVEHLLKLRHSPAREPRVKWTETVLRARIGIGVLLADGLSLAHGMDEVFAKASGDGAKLAGRSLDAHGKTETQPLSRLLAEHGFMLDQVLGDWFPEPLNA